jgi:hypothetical protein
VGCFKARGYRNSCVPILVLSLDKPQNFGGRTLDVEGPYEIEFNTAAFRRLLHFPIAAFNVNQTVDEKLIAAAQLLIGKESKLDSMPGTWIIKCSTTVKWVELTAQESKAKRHKPNSDSLDEKSIGPMSASLRLVLVKTN